MKYALLSDIHSNLHALDACLAHAQALGAERVVILGDLVSYGAFPAEVVARCQALQQAGAALMGLEDGRPLLSVHALGSGAIVLSGLAFDPDWSNLPLKGGFLALAQSMALLRLATPTGVESMVAGNRPALPARVWVLLALLNLLEHQDLAHV